MSASIPGGGGKSANFELNLVPFIDLFSALICFLLMTAAWQNLETVNTGTPPKSLELRNDQDSAPVVDENGNSKATLAVTLYYDRLEFTENGDVRRYPHQNGNPDYRQLEMTLAEWHGRYPDRKDVLLSTENRSPYKHLIRMMDVFIAGGFPEVGITLN